jgi:hypothetical protein
MVEEAPMKKKMFFSIAALWGILAVVSAPRARAGADFVGEHQADHSRDTYRSVNVYGPEVLTDLAGLAIQEKRPDVVVVEHYKPLKHKVWIEGTTGSGYMPLSTKRAHRMEAAKSRGGSVYSALCDEQKRIIQETVGVTRVYRHVVRECRTVTRTCYVRPVYFAPPPPPVCVYPVAYGFGGPCYAYGGYAGWGRYPYGGWGGYRYYRGGYGGYRSGAFYRGHAR